MANRPTETLRDGSLKATIWKNAGEKGASFSVNLSHTYNCDAGYDHSDSFSGTEFPRPAHLAARAYDCVSELR